jgi:hypothetical protein
MKRARDETTKKLEGEELNDAIYDVVEDGNVSGLRDLLETYDNNVCKVSFSNNFQTISEHQQSNVFGSMMDHPLFFFFF